MANVNIKFNNKDYLLSCDDGQEESLKSLTKFLDKKYSELEIEAKNNKIGIWSDLSLISPWKYRRGGKKRKSIEKLHVSKQKIIKMRKIIPLMLIGFALTAFQEKEVKKVFICKSVASKRYHLKKTCK